MYNIAIRKCTSPLLLASRLKIFKLKFTTPPGSNPGPAEPEADMLPSEPARQFIKVARAEHQKPKFVSMTICFSWLYLKITFIYIYYKCYSFSVLILQIRWRKKTKKEFRFSEIGIILWWLYTRSEEQRDWTAVPAFNQALRMQEEVNEYLYKLYTS